jgi:glycosyltransferase involved in cell wall biosynthesis
MKENDIVYLMAEDLKDLCDLTIIDTCIYSGNKEKWWKADYSHSLLRPIRWLDEKKVLSLVERVNPDFVIVNAGGMALTKNTVRLLKEKNIITVGISLSDPDVFPQHGKYYADLFDIFYTNSKYSLENSYTKLSANNVKILGFATSTKLHKPMPEIEKEYDVVIVGHYRRDRAPIVKKLQEKFNLGLFGKGWGSENKSVHGIDHVKAINSGKIYLSFAQTAARYTNVKVGIFEAMACKSFILTKFFNEMELYFKYGIEIIGYNNKDQINDIVDFYLKRDELRNTIADNGYQRFLKEHTWNRRWTMVLGDIRKIKNK